jgi:ATP-dependent Lhr-like helicase
LSPGALLVGKPIQRIGLSATQRPLEEIGRFVGGGRPIELVDAGVAKQLDLQVVVPVEDMRELGSTAQLNQRTPEAGESYITPGLEVGSSSIWPSIYPALRATKVDQRLPQHQPG